MNQKIKVVCQQLAPAVGDPGGNAVAARTAIADAVAVGADLVVLPELVLSGYVFRSADEVESAAHPRDSPVFDQWAALLSGGGLVVGGFPEIDPLGRVFNSVAVVDGDGVRAVYRKTHLWDAEKLWFTPGEDLPPILETDWGRLGVLICYDLEFPEMTRGLAIRGADILAAPTNWPLSPRPDGERPPEVLDACSTARLNGLFLACCDRVGTERGVQWTGGSCIVDTNGWLLDERVDRDLGMVTAEVTIAQARDKALNDRNDILRDRRPELYSALIEPMDGSGRELGR